MKRICCIDCKWATRRWNGTGLLFCRSSVEQSWSWAEGKAIRHAKQCETLNDDGHCACYKPRVRKRFWTWVYSVIWNVRKRG